MECIMHISMILSEKEKKIFLLAPAAVFAVRFCRKQCKISMSIDSKFIDFAVCDRTPFIFSWCLYYEFKDD